MKSKYVTLAAAAGLCLAPFQVPAQEINVSPDKNASMKVSIYNQNLALVKDTRQVELKDGTWSVAFEGVAQQMQPETALLQGEGVKVLEQNYEYDLLTPANIIEESIGQKVKTVRVNPSNGDLIMEQAEIVNNNYGKPLLKMKYGVVDDFPGWVAFDSLPANLRLKPTLVVKLENSQELKKDLTLNYLTGGLNWSANYVAELGKDDTLDLQGWVTLNNQSGADYKNAEVQLVAGSVQAGSTPVPMPVLPRANLMMAKGMAAEATMDSASLPAQNLADYYLYTLPQKTDIMDKQSKQISLMNKPGVKYSKLYRLQSPLSLYWGNNDGEFERVRPSLVYKLVNNTESNLGDPLPAGMVRFYEKDSSGNLQFTGAAELNQLAKGETAELAVGEAFDLYAKGKVVNMQKLSDKMVESEVEITFHNAKNTEQTIEFEQSFPGSVEVVSESLESTKDKARRLKWEVSVPADGDTVLTFKVRVVRL